MSIPGVTRRGLLLCPEGSRDVNLGLLPCSPHSLFLEDRLRERVMLILGSQEQRALFWAWN